MPEKTLNNRDGKVNNGIITEYVSPMGGSKTIVIIDSGTTGMRFISVDPGQVTPVIKNFPVGSRVAFYWSEKENHYIFQEPDAT
jgi:hypothetical protein